jgi:two-component system, OmpR family, osmolarity sensor histidine kinase EnvZ
VRWPRRRLWRAFFWIAAVAILIEVLGLTSTFVELHRQTTDDAAGLAPDQIAAVAHLWPSLSETQRRGVLAAISWAGLSYRITSEAPVASRADTRARAVEDAVRKRLVGAEANSVNALISSKAGPTNERRVVEWPLSSEPMRVYVRLATGDWLVAEVRGDLLPRFFGLPTGFWMGVIGLLLACGVLLVILREGRAVERIARSVEAFASTGMPQPFKIGGSPEITGLANRTLQMQQQVATLLSERNAMLGAIAHDIKTYIQRLKLRLEVLDDANQVEKAGRDLDAMNKLVEDALLVAVHANALESKHAVDLLTVVAHEVEAARMAGGDISLKHDSRGPYLVDGDRSALSRALSNIIGNALRYGTQTWVSVGQKNKAVEVIVDDNGPGIPAAERQAVFTAFHRAEASRNRATGGTGLGLAIALGIIERQHGGSIDIEDAPGGGARLRISVPSIMGKLSPEAI